MEREGDFGALTRLRRRSLSLPIGPRGNETKITALAIEFRGHEFVS